MSNTIDSALFKKMFLAGAASLESKKEWINELNVFPVPDGDTGTNMTMTIMSSLLSNPTLTVSPDSSTAEPMRIIQEPMAIRLRRTIWYTCQWMSTGLRRSMIPWDMLWAMSC